MTDPDPPSWLFERRRFDVQIPGQDDLPIAQEIYPAPDRSAAILATSWLDEYLTAAIKSKLLEDKDTANKLLKPSGPLGAFATKAELGYLLGMYSKQSRDDLIHISGIRNIFAHWIKTVDFGSRDVRPKCESLTLFDRTWSQHSNYEEMKSKRPRPFTRVIAREFFLETIGIAVTLLNWIKEHNIKDGHTRW
jgi:hypothetical protein